MVAHRCDLADVAMPFSDDVITQIYDATGGVPREVLKVCAVSYELAQLNELDRVTLEVLEEALKEAVLA
jgi:Cdc6-like AAA superfamily ATPase